MTRSEGIAVAMAAIEEAGLEDLAHDLAEAVVLRLDEEFGIVTENEDEELEEDE